MADAIKVLDHGYIRLIEAWGHGDAGVCKEITSSYYDLFDYECGIIEAARQSTQGSFRGWEDKRCPEDHIRFALEGIKCPTCNGKSYLPGDKRLLAYLYDNRHSTPFEFSGMTIEVQAPIMVFREWHRHRTQGYNEMSARYEPMPDLNYVPTIERLMLNAGGTNKQAGTVKGSAELTEQTAQEFRDALAVNYQIAETDYQEALRTGVPKELARLVIPVGRYSRMRATANLRNWLAFLTLRMDPKAQWEIRMYANEIGRIIEQQFPRTWALFTKPRTEKA